MAQAAFNVGAYIDVHLSYELCGLAKAAAAWTRSRDPSTRNVHLEEMSQLAALVHFRSICEFLTADGRWKNQRLSPHRPIAIAGWSTYEEWINAKALHPDPRRPYIPGTLPGDDLKDQIAVLAQEALDGWTKVANQSEMAVHAGTMADVRSRALASVAGNGYPAYFT